MKGKRGTEMHDRVRDWVRLHNTTDEKMVVSSMSTKQRAKNLALDGRPIGYS